jgi:hypothetical protein
LADKFVLKFSNPFLQPLSLQNDLGLRQKAIKSKIFPENPSPHQSFPKSIPETWVIFIRLQHIKKKQNEAPFQSMYIFDLEKKHLENTFKLSLKPF